MNDIVSFIVEVEAPFVKIAGFFSVLAVEIAVQPVHEADNLSTAKVRFIYAFANLKNRRQSYKQNFVLEKTRLV